MATLTLNADTAQLPHPDGVLLWQTRTGRHAVLAQATLDMLDDPRLEAVRIRLLRLSMLGDVDHLHLIVVRSRLVLTLPDALWLPVPTVRTAGGYGYHARPLDEDERRIWDAINDARTVEQVAARAHVDVDRVLAFTDSLCAYEVQALQLREQPPHRRDASLTRLVSPPRPEHDRSDDQTGDGGETTLRDYHLHGITDGATHFDNRETTIAHAFGVAHPALEGQRFGERLFDQLAARGLVPDGRTMLLEIGGGDGELAEAWCRKSHSHRPQMRYLRVDLSPELLRTQAAKVPDSPGMVASATQLPIRDASIDLVLSNEVIADLTSVPYDPAAVETPAQRAVQERLERYGLLDAEGLYNLGAWQLVEELMRVLVPGGVAYLSEFGGIDRPPEETVQLDHPEVSIHFGQLDAVATSLGFEVVSLPMADLLEVDFTATQVARHSWEGLRALARSRGVHLAARAWTAATLEHALGIEVGGIDWVPLTEPGPGPLITRFQCLLLRKRTSS